MTLIHPNIVPENDLRLRHDFGELLYLNEREVAHGNWFKLVNMYNPAYCDLSPENSYWISGENEKGDIVLTQAGRIYYWPETSLAEEAHSMFYAGRGEGQLCNVTAPAAGRIGGVVFCPGSHWIRPDFRGRQLSHLLARLGRAYAMSRWPVDWAIALVAPLLVEKGVSAGYGYKHASRSIFYPDSPWGDLEVVLAYLSQSEAYQDIAEYLGKEFSGSMTEGLSTASAPRPRDDKATYRKDHWVPFLARCISGSRASSAFLVDDGALMMPAFAGPHAASFVRARPSRLE